MNGAHSTHDMQSVLRPPVKPYSRGPVTKLTFRPSILQYASDFLEMFYELLEG